MANSKLGPVFTAFAVIVIVYIGYGVYSDTRNYNIYLPRVAKLALRLFSTFAIYFAGILAFKKYEVRWVSEIWQTVYLLFFILLALTEVYALLAGAAPAPLRNILKTLEEFLVSPLFYVALVAISRTLTKNSANG